MVRVEEGGNDVKGTEEEGQRSGEEFKEKSVCTL